MSPRPPPLKAVEIDPVVIEVARDILGVKFAEAESNEALLAGWREPPGGKGGAFSRARYSTGGGGTAAAAAAAAAAVAAGAVSSPAGLLAPGVSVACGDAGDALRLAADAARVRPGFGADVLFVDAFDPHGIPVRRDTHTWHAPRCPGLQA